MSMDDIDTDIETTLRRLLSKVDDEQSALAMERHDVLRQIGKHITKDWEPGDMIHASTTLGRRSVVGPLPFAAVKGDTEVYVIIGTGLDLRSYPVSAFTFENLTLAERKGTVTE